MIALLVNIVIVPPKTTLCFPLCIWGVGIKPENYDRQAGKYYKFTVVHGGYNYSEIA
jgi:hypothetical protein